MNRDNQTTSIESPSRETEYDGTEPLDDPADEAIAQFLAAPEEFRQFKSVSALAKHFNLSRMTVYRRKENVDVVERIKWLLEKSMLFGDLIACREWASIVKAQVKAALGGDTRAALFCQNRAWRQSLIVLEVRHIEPAIAEADAITVWQEKPNEQSEAEELGAQENPATKWRQAERMRGASAIASWPSSFFPRAEIQSYRCHAGYLEVASGNAQRQASSLFAHKVGDYRK